MYCIDIHAAAPVVHQAAVAAWGTRQLAVLDAEDRLSVACEKGLTNDAVVLALREAFQVSCAWHALACAAFIHLCMCALHTGNAE